MILEGFMASEETNHYNYTDLKTSSLLSLLLDNGRIVGAKGDFFKICPRLPPSTIVDPISDNTKNECQCVCKRKTDKLSD